MFEQTKLRLAIRHARLSDIPALKALVDQSVRGLLQDHYTPRQIESSLIYLFGVDAQLIEDRTYYIAEVDGQLAGIGGWSRRQALYGYDEASHGNGAASYLDPHRDPAHIRAFFVHPDFARRGIASELLAISEADARRSGFRKAELIATWAGVPVYEKAGYVTVGSEKVFLPDGVSLTGLRMMKNLN